MNRDTQLLNRYLDGELPPDQARKFRARLAQSPALRQQLAEMQRVGDMLRLWGDAAEHRAGQLLQPTLSRIHEAERRRVRHTTLAFALGALLVAVLPWQSQAYFSGEAQRLRSSLRASGAKAPAAAIERIESGDKQARVFRVGSSRTPVVWLVDEASDDDASVHQDPG